MKKILLLLIICFTYINLNAQVYPFIEDFNSMTPFTSPAGGWVSTVAGFQIYPNHGDNSQGMTKQLTSFQTVDSVVSPLIGPIGSSSILFFEYRAVESSLYPAIAATLTAGDRLEIKVLNGTVLTTIATFDQSNHFNSTFFASPFLTVDQFAGDNIKIIFKVSRALATNDYFFDFDNIAVVDAAGIKENTKSLSTVECFPNPVKTNENISLKNIEPGNYQLKITNCSGTNIISNNINITSQAIISNEEFSAGYYLGSLINNNKNYIFKFIVQ